MSNLLSTKLNGNRPLGAYFQSWSSGWSSSGANLDLAKIPQNINIIFLSFVRPNCSYQKGSMSLSGTGLDFSSDFSVVRDAIKILRNRNCVVMLSVGGATYHFDSTFNPTSIIALANDLGVDGIDIDWEPTNGSASSNELGNIINKFRTSYPTGLLSMAAFSVGAYGFGAYTASPPASSSTGMCVSGLKSNGSQLDFICLMSYDASNAYDPITGFQAYRSYFKGPILIGCEVPPEAWGGHVLTLQEAQKYAQYAVTDKVASNGLFVWSYQKQGTPSCSDIISTAKSVFGSTTTTTTTPTTTTPTTTPTTTTPTTTTPTTTTPTTSTTTTSTTSTTAATTTTTTNSFSVAPYIDSTLWPPFDLVSAAKSTGHLYYTLAFIISDGTGPSWGGYYPLKSTNPPWFMDKITALRAMGGDVIISCGGAAGQELAQTITDVQALVSAYQTIVNQYKVKILDLDIEGSAIADNNSVDRRNKALVILKKNNPNLKIHYTLPVMPDGLDFNALNLLKNAKSNGLVIDLCNLMAMDYGQGNKEMGKAAISASQNTRNQLISIGYSNTKIGICPMIGVNDTSQEVFSLNNAQEVLTFAKNNSYIGLISFWSQNRDVANSNLSTTASTFNTGIVQSAFSFLNIFKQFKSSSTITAPTTPTTPTTTTTITTITTPTTPTTPTTTTPTTSTTTTSTTSTTAATTTTTTTAPTTTTSSNLWKANTAYTTGQIVSYNGSNYKCIQSHTSIVTWEPSIYTQALWQKL